MSFNCDNIVPFGKVCEKQVAVGRQKLVEYQDSYNYLLNVNVLTIRWENLRTGLRHNPEWKSVLDAVLFEEYITASGVGRTKKDAQAIALLELWKRIPKSIQECKEFVRERIQLSEDIMPQMMSGLIENTMGTGMKPFVPAQAPRSGVSTDPVPRAGATSTIGILDFENPMTVPGLLGAVRAGDDVASQPCEIATLEATPGMLLEEALTPQESAAAEVVPDHSADVSESIEFPEFVGKKVPFATVALSISDNSNAVIYKCDLPGDILNQWPGGVPNLKPVETYANVTPNIKVTAISNATQFDVGEVILCVRYGDALFEDPDSAEVMSAAQAVVAPHARMNISTTNPVELEIPYFGPYAQLQTSDSISTPMYFATLYLVVNAPLKRTPDVVDAVEIKLYAEFIEGTTFRNLRESHNPGYIDVRNIDKKIEALMRMKRELEGVRPQGASQSSTNITNNWIIDGNNNEVTGGTGSSTSSQETGVDATIKPRGLPTVRSGKRSTLTSDTIRLIPVQTCSMSNGLGTVDLNRLTLDPDASLSLSDYPIPLAGQQSWSYLNSLRARLGMFAWTKDDGIGTKLLEVPNSPVQWAPISSGEVEALYWAPLSLGAACHKYMRGNLQWDFDVIKSTFHTGKLRISYFADHPSDERNYENSLSVPSLVYDFKDSNSVSFDSPLMSTFIANPIWTDETEGSVNPLAYGYVCVFVETPLQIMDSITPVVDVVYYVHSDNMEYITPIPPRFRQFRSVATVDVVPQMRGFGSDARNQRFETCAPTLVRRLRTGVLGESASLEAETQRFNLYFVREYEAKESCAFVFDVTAGAITHRRTGNNYDFQTFVHDIYKFYVGGFRYNFRISSLDNNAVANVYHVPQNLTGVLDDVEILDDVRALSNLRGNASEPLFLAVQPMISVDVPWVSGCRVLQNGLESGYSTSINSSAYRNGQMVVEVINPQGSGKVRLECWRALSSDGSFVLYQGHRLMSSWADLSSESYKTTGNVEHFPTMYVGYQVNNPDEAITTEILDFNAGVLGGLRSSSGGRTEVGTPEDNWKLGEPKDEFRWFEYLEYYKGQAGERLRVVNRACTVSKFERLGYPGSTLLLNVGDRYFLFPVIRYSRSDLSPSTVTGRRFDMFCYVFTSDNQIVYYWFNQIPYETTGPWNKVDPISELSISFETMQKLNYVNVNERLPTYEGAPAAWRMHKAIRAQVVPQSVSMVDKASSTTNPQGEEEVFTDTADSESCLGLPDPCDENIRPQVFNSMLTDVLSSISPSKILGLSGSVAAGAVAYSAIGMRRAAESSSANLNAACASIQSIAERGAAGVTDLVAQIKNAVDVDVAEKIASMDVPNLSLHIYSLIRSDQWDVKLAAFIGVLYSSRMIKFDMIETATAAMRCLYDAWQSYRGDLVQPQAPMPNGFTDADPLIRKVSDALMTAVPLAAGMLGFASQWSKGYASASLSLIKNLFSTANSVSSFLRGSLDWIKGLVYWCMKRENPLLKEMEAKTELEKEVMNWSERVVAITAAHKRHMCLNNLEMAMEVGELKIQGDKIISGFVSESTTIGVRQTLNMLWRELKEVHDELGCLVRGGPPVDPYCIWLVGGAGVGKSTVLNGILCEGARALGVVFDGDPVYVVDQNTDYDNLFRGQPCVMWDDMGIVTEPSMLGRQIALFLAIKSAQEVNANMPDISQKRNIMNFKLCGVASNKFTIRSALIGHQEAFERRRNMVVDVSLSPRFRKDFPRAQGLGADEVMEAIRDRKLDVRQYMQFRIYTSAHTVRKKQQGNIVTGPPPMGRCLSYVEFIDEYITKMKVYMANQEQLSTYRAEQAQMLSPSAWLALGTDRSEERDRAVAESRTVAGFSDLVRARFTARLSEARETLRRVREQLSSAVARGTVDAQASTSTEEQEEQGQSFTATVLAHVDEVLEASEVQPQAFNTLAFESVPIGARDTRREDIHNTANLTSRNHEFMRVGEVAQARPRPKTNWHVVRDLEVQANFPIYGEDPDFECTCNADIEGDVFGYGELRHRAAQNRCVHALIGPEMAFCNRHQCFSGVTTQVDGDESYELWLPPIPMRRCCEDCILKTEVDVASLWLTWHYYVTGEDAQDLPPMCKYSYKEFIDPSKWAYYKDKLTKGFNKIKEWIKTHTPKIVMYLGITSVLLAPLLVDKILEKTETSPVVVSEGDDINLILAPTGVEEAVMHRLTNAKVDVSKPLCTVTHYDDVLDSVRTTRFNVDDVKKALQAIKPVMQLNSSSGNDTRHARIAKFAKQTKMSVVPQSAQDKRKTLERNCVKFYDDSEMLLGKGFGIYERCVIVPLHYKVALPEVFHVETYEGRRTLVRDSMEWLHVEPYDLALLRLPDRDCDNSYIGYFRDRFGMLASSKAQVCAPVRSSFVQDFQDGFKTIVPTYICAVDGKIGGAMYDACMTKVAELTMTTKATFAGFQVGVGETYDGMCGAVMFNRQSGFITGMHVAGASQFGFYQIVTKEMFAKHYDGLTVRGRDTPDRPLEPRKVALRGTFIPIEALPQGKKIMCSAKTKLQESSMAGYMAEVYGPPAREPAQMVFEGDQYKGQYCLETGVGHRTNPHQTLPMAYILEVEEFLMQKVLALCRPTRCPRSRHPLGVGVCGIPGTDFRPLQLDTSPGFPLSSTHAGSTKASFVDVRDGKLLGMSSVLADEIRRCETDLLKGTVPYAPWQAFIKDECLPPGKQARLIEGCPFAIAVLFRQYCMDYFLAVRESGFDIGVAIGMNINGPDAQRLVSKLMVEGRTKVLANDFSKFGPRLDSELVRSCGRTVNAWYARHCSSESGFATHQRARACLFEHLANADIAVYDTVFRTLCGSPSGNPATADINSDCAIRYHAVAWLMLAPGVLKDLSVWWNNVKVIAYGDDTIISVADSVADFYNSVTIGNVFADYGIKYTNADKGDEMLPWTTLDKATFLKHYFVRDEEGTYQGALEKAMITGIPRWIRNPCPDESLRLYDQCKSALLHAAGWGGEFYSSFRSTLQSWFVASGVDMSFPSYRTVHAMRAGHLDSDALNILRGTFDLDEADMYALGQS
nr:polyprotein [buhirugu virus 14]